jgi:hypothetical protein
MGDATARAIPGTEGVVVDPAFSPDGQSIVFFAATGRDDGARTMLIPKGVIKRVRLDGGMPETLCEASFPFGISWNSDAIVFGQLSKGIMHVSPSGGSPTVLVGVKEDEGALGPQLLPGGRVVLFTHVNGVKDSGSVLGVNDLTRGGGRLWSKAKVVVQSARHQPTNSSRRRRH